LLDSLLKEIILITMSGINQCEDYMMFQRALKQLRDIDDKFLFALNLSTPTPSIKARGTNPTESCRDLQNEMESNYKHRNESLNRCITLMGAEVKKYKSEFEGGNDPALPLLRTKQSTLRMLRNELNVEEIIQDRTRALFNVKCKEFLS
jgi:hypothetical protein